MRNKGIAYRCTSCSHWFIAARCFFDACINSIFNHINHHIHHQPTEITPSPFPKYGAKARRTRRIFHILTSFTFGVQLLTQWIRVSPENQHKPQMCSVSVRTTSTTILHATTMASWKHNYVPQFGRGDHVLGIGDTTGSNFGIGRCRWE